MGQWAEKIGYVPQVSLILLTVYIAPATHVTLFWLTPFAVVVWLVRQVFANERATQVRDLLDAAQQAGYDLD